MSDLNKYIKSAADPVSAALRIENLLNIPEFEKSTKNLSASDLKSLVDLISLSGFLYRYLRRHPYSAEVGSESFSPQQLKQEPLSSMEELRTMKYKQLLNITWMDFSNNYGYEKILFALSHLAEFIFNKVIDIGLPDTHSQLITQHMATFGLGKLGASELNFSSDIDLIFVCSNTSDVDLEIHHYQKILQDSIRLLSSHLEKMTSEGFLYRVDLKLRPWGRSGPLVMTINETENYYEASSEIWERFAWLRARQIMGSEKLACDLKARLKSFVYRRSLSEDDLDRFLEIKNEMCNARRKKRHWNVKVGEGGIRDIEFFIQMLQIVNAYRIPELQETGTISILNTLKNHGLVEEEEAAEVLHSYLFLRKLENRLQMIEEQQTHELPDEHDKRIIIARSMGIAGKSNDEILDIFETELFANQMIAKSYFDRILPGK